MGASVVRTIPALKVLVHLLQKVVGIGATPHKKQPQTAVQQSAG